MFSSRDIKRKAGFMLHKNGLNSLTKARAEFYADWSRF